MARSAAAPVMTAVMAVCRPYGPPNVALHGNWKAHLALAAVTKERARMPGSCAKSDARAAHPLSMASCRFSLPDALFPATSWALVEAEAWSGLGVTPSILLGAGKARQVAGQE